MTDSDGAVRMTASEIVELIRTAMVDAEEFAQGAQCDDKQRHGWGSRYIGYRELLQQIPGTPEQLDLAKRAALRGEDL